MANYQYDEGGNMSAYFIISFLALVLVPLTISLLSSGSKNHIDVGCQCQLCLDQRAKLREQAKRSILNPKFSYKAWIVVLGWSLFAFIIYKTAGAKMENAVYDPFEILGLSAGVTEKEIKSHFKKLSKKFHPDKVVLGANDTVEAIANKFVDITKAYKSLTDETIRRNWELYGHPDGRQEMSVGIAIPQWIIESKNNIWVLGFYGLIVGGFLPFLVGRWWFGSRQKTKDGVKAESAAVFFKGLREDSIMGDVVGVVGKVYQWESNAKVQETDIELKELEKNVAGQMGAEWRDVLKLAGVGKGDGGNKLGYGRRKRALVLLYAHFLRIKVVGTSLQKEQSHLLLQTPILLNALLTISTSRSWLHPTLAIMRLHAYLTQALLPGKQQLKLAQLPNIKIGEETSVDKVEEYVGTLEQKKDGRVGDVKRALDAWGRLELVEANFKVIGERLVVPSSIVYLIVKLRRTPPRVSPAPAAKEKDADETKRILKFNDEKDNQFLNSKEEAEGESNGTGWVHAPYWPGNRKPGWWLVLADDKSGRIVVPPMKINDVPASKPDQDRDYRSYKLQFQAPNNVGLFTWKVYFVSDSFVGEDICVDIALKIEDVSALNADEQGAEDEISDPEEDTLAGQMAAMRGGSVKKIQEYEESDEESSTDDDQGSDNSSDSDSD